jgi:AcrR family transcriptional regulator
MAVDTKKAPGRPRAGAREALIEAAHELFMRRDFDRVSTGEILERSGVSRGALYHHFPSKLDLFRAVYEASERRVIARLVAEIPSESSPGEALVAGARAYLRQCETDEELRRIGLVQSRVVLGWEGWRAVAEGLGLGLVLGLATAAIEAGELPPLDPETTALILLGALIDAAMPIALADDRAGARKRSEAVIVDLLEGLRR